jgi:4-amino-4-deoxy-L-arabinose transferase-like glycosyltransferase
MKEINALVVLLAIFVYIVVVRKQKKPTNKPDLPDTARSAIDEFGIKHEWPSYLPYVLALAPLYLGYNHDQFPKIFEHGVVLYVLFLFLRAVQLLNNKETRHTPEYTLPVSTLLVLLYVYHGIIKDPKHAYLYLCAHAATVLMMYRKTTTLSTLIDDVVLAHLVFYVFK